MKNLHLLTQNLCSARWDAHPVGGMWRWRRMEGNTDLCLTLAPVLGCVLHRGELGAKSPACRVFYLSVTLSAYHWFMHVTPWCGSIMNTQVWLHGTVTWDGVRKSSLQGCPQPIWLARRTAHRLILVVRGENLPGVCIYSVLLVLVPRLSINTAVECRQHDRCWGTTRVPSLWKPANNFSLSRTSKQDCCSTRSLLDMIKDTLLPPPTMLRLKLETKSCTSLFWHRYVTFRKLQNLCMTTEKEGLSWLSEPRGWMGEMCSSSVKPLGWPVVFLPNLMWLVGR